MINLSFEDTVFVYTNDEKNQRITLFDMKDYENNFSNVSLQKAEDCTFFYDLFNQVIDEFNSMANNAPEADYFEFANFISIYLKFLLTKSRPVRVLEIGYSKSNIGYFLAKIAREFNVKSKVFCVSDNLYDDYWMDLINKLDVAQENISIITGDITCEYITDDYYDFVVINGNEQVYDPEQTVSNAVRCCKKGDKIVCLTKNQEQLYKSFCECADNCIDYQQFNDWHILEKTVDNNVKHTAYMKSTKHMLNTYVQNIKLACEDIHKLLREKRVYSNDEINAYVEKLICCEDISIELLQFYDCHSLKNNLIILKDFFMQYLFTNDNNARSELIEDMTSILQDVLNDIDVLC